MHMHMHMHIYCKNRDYCFGLIKDRDPHSLDLHSHLIVTFIDNIFGKPMENNPIARLHVTPS